MDSIGIIETHFYHKIKMKNIKLSCCFRKTIFPIKNLTSCIIKHVYYLLLHFMIRKSIVWVDNTTQHKARHFIL